MFRCRLPLLLLLSLTLLACPGNKAPAKDPAPPPATPAAPKQEGPSCDERKQSFKKILTEASGLCEVDADCAPWPILFDCGGITGRYTAEKLRAIRKQWRDKKCGLGVRCAARMRQIPVCVDGICAGKPMGKGPPK